MSCECKRQGDLCDPCTDLIEVGIDQERRRIMTILEARYPIGTSFADIIDLIRATA